MQKSFWRKLFGLKVDAGPKGDLALLFKSERTAPTAMVHLVREADDFRGWAPSAVVWLRLPSQEEAEVAAPLRTIGTKFFHLVEDVGATTTQDVFTGLIVEACKAYGSEDQFTLACLSVKIMHELNLLHPPSGPIVALMLQGRKDVVCVHNALYRRVPTSTQHEQALQEVAKKGGKVINHALHDGHWARVVACAALGLRKPSNPK